jgi:choline dehydrogenase-like flavoprotein
MAPVSKPSEGEYDAVVIGGGSGGSASSVRLSSRLTTVFVNRRALRHS